VTTNRPPTNTTLIRAARAFQLAHVLQGALWWGVFSASGLLALLLVDDWLHLPQALRLPLAVVLIGFIAIEFYRKVLKPLLRPISPAQAARLLEINRGIGGNVLINAYQFEHDPSKSEWKKFVAPVLASSSSILGEIPPRSLWLTPRLKTWFIGLMALLCLWILLAAAFPRYITTGMERIFMPLSDVPPVGSWSIEVSPNGHISLVAGDRLDILVRLHSDIAGAKPPTPILAWQEGAGSSESSINDGEHAAMLPGAHAGEYVFSFNAVSQPFSFRVWTDDSRSSAVQVDVSPLPQIKGSTFDVTPPEYTGLKPYAQPGPPSALEVPVGSTVNASLELSSNSAHVLWQEGATVNEMTQNNDKWQFSKLVIESSNYQLLTKLQGLTEPRVLAQGQITALPDHPPDIDFVTQDRNRAVNPGDTLSVTIHATDDYGVAAISLQIAPSNDPTTARVLKSWNYLGPPGQKEPAPETYTITLDPSVFTPGSTFLLTAHAADFSPNQQWASSRPIILRVAGLTDLAVPQGDALEKLFEILRNTIAVQTQGNFLTSNLILHLSEALAANDLPKHYGGMADAQKQAQDLGAAALDEAGKHDEGKIYLPRLEALIKGEMDLAQGQIGKLPDTSKENLATGLDALQKRQTYILNGLISLLGQMSTDRQQAAQAQAKKQQDSTPPITVEQEVAKLKDELKSFGNDQKRIINASKAIQALNPEDLTSEQQAVLGEMAREEAKEASYFQEKLTDLSKLPMQDFADGKLVKDMNEVYQEVQAASTALYQKRTEIAVPAEEAGLEKAAEIEQNLERWLPNTPDNVKWSMEEPAQAPTDVPMAELPKELDDLVGDLLKKEQEMDQDKDDVSSSIMDSIDKGAGWGADDGPMSNMSAKGVTGNQLPNNDEIGGRSGEGRNGKSDGQMVGNTAVGKGGNETPTRMTPTPFENGSVNDQSKDTKGGATGGGKLAGTGQEGLRGPMAPQVQERVKVLAEQQAKLRQQAESLALQLQRQRKPTGDLETAINAMKNLESAAGTQNGLGVVQGYHQALDSLQAARAVYAGDRLSRVETDSLARDARKDVNDTQAEAAPAGYEEMTGAYFRSLSESPPTSPAPPAQPAPAK
jgi:hypothetical protein